MDPVLLSPVPSAAGMLDSPPPFASATDFSAGGYHGASPTATLFQDPFAGVRAGDVNTLAVPSLSSAGSIPAAGALAMPPPFVSTSGFSTGVATTTAISPLASPAGDGNLAVVSLSSAGSIPTAGVSAPSPPSIPAVVSSAGGAAPAALSPLAAPDGILAGGGPPAAADDVVLDISSWPCEISALPEFWVSVECGLNGNCLYHSLSWLCDRAIAVRELLWGNGAAIPPLAEQHVSLRALILNHMRSRASSILLNKEEFGYEDISQVSLQQRITSNEQATLDDYISVHKKLHQFAGYPELVAWTSLSKRPLILIEQHQKFKVAIFRPVDESNVRVQRETWREVESSNVIVRCGCWAEAAFEMERGSFCLLQQSHHYMAIVPKIRLSTSCPNPSDRPKAWAHFVSRPITFHKAQLEKQMPIIVLRP